MFWCIYINSCNVELNHPIYKLEAALEKIAFFNAEGGPINASLYDRIVICGFIP